jgi:hypothetical protein
MMTTVIIAVMMMKASMEVEGRSRLEKIECENYVVDE